LERLLDHQRLATFDRRWQRANPPPPFGHPLPLRRERAHEPPAERVVATCYFPTSSNSNVPSMIGGRRWPSTGGPNWAVGRKRWWVLLSRAMVRAPRAVGTLSATVKLSGDFSCTTVMVPSAPLELKAFCEASSNAAP